MDQSMGVYACDHAPPKAPLAVSAQYAECSEHQGKKVDILSIQYTSRIY